MTPSLGRSDLALRGLSADHMVLIYKVMNFPIWQTIKAAVMTGDLSSPPPAPPLNNNNNNNNNNK